MQPLASKQLSPTLTTDAPAEKRAEWKERTRRYFADVAQRQGELAVTLAELFPAPGELVWEVGCGHGHFLTGYAAQFPGRACIGVDILRDRIARAERKRVRAKLAHLRFLQADATEFLAALPSHVVLGEVFVLFPDPWPKRRHHKNRLMQPAFLRAVAARAGQGARLFFRTDHADYFRSAVRALDDARSGWRIAPEVPWPWELPTVFQQKASSYYSVVATRAETPP